LPTEAQWEWAARAGSTGPRYGDVDDIAWFRDNSGRRRIEGESVWPTDGKEYQRQLLDNGNGPKPVAQKHPNDYGLYDMLGNVWQWVADWYDPAYYASGESVDPRGPKTGTMRSMRGASWGLGPKSIRVSERYREAPGKQSIDGGLRCAGE
jgi:sulfatase modifying factor 1